MVTVIVWRLWSHRGPVVLAFRLVLLAFKTIQPARFCAFIIRCSCYGVPGFLYQSYQLIAYDDRLLAVSSTSFLNVSELKGDTQVRAWWYGVYNCSLFGFSFSKTIYADIFPGWTQHQLLLLKLKDYTEFCSWFSNPNSIHQWVACSRLTWGLVYSWTANPHCQAFQRFRRQVVYWYGCCLLRQYL